ncbi:MAG: sugar phosphate isomerase/epimerase [Ignisphaera sp.]|nr:sugar phosphate isomerase/epimerase [Ignisphaera sp.]MCX8167749.1 sugar phosphate isomerase/epimerase [Ignisphaera sp.]MDW8086221.1 sugar phosphate isomerase/epimerase family protein [Ignisphaera sp.]
MVRYDSLSRLDEFKGFLEGNAVNKFLEVFDIKFGSGTWAAGPFSDRFMGRGYSPELASDIISKLERIRKAGISAFVPINVEFFDESFNIRWDLVDSVGRYAEANDMVIAGFAIDLSGIPQFKHGTLANPNPSLRRKSMEIIINSMEIAKRLNVDVVSFWPGQDGWDYSFEVNHGKMIATFLDGLRELAYEAVKRNMMLCIEAKLKEPREGNMIIPTTHAAIAMAKKINDELNKRAVGITIDYGHELMYAVEPAYTVYLSRYFDVPLLSIHINTAKTHSNDEDRVVGTGDIWQLIDFLYATIDVGYNGWYILDQFTYRMDPVDGMRLSKEFFVNAMKKALEIYRHRDEIEKVREGGDEAKVLDLVKEILYNF